MKKRYGIVFCLMMIISFGLINANDIFAKQTSVSSTQQLQQAINDNDDVLITDDFTVTKTIVIPKAYSGTISSGAKNTLTAAEDVADMFSVDGADVTFENIKVNMGNKGRFLHIVNNKIVNVNKVDVENSTSEYSVKHAEGGAIFVNGGTLNITDSSFSKSVANKNANAPADSLPHGGAIYGYSVRMNITNSSFSNNKSYAAGGAIYVDGNNTSVLNIDGTKDKSVFTANSLSKFDTIAQGGAVYVGPGVESSISNTTFNVGFMFNTGGAVRYLGAKNAKIADCEFIIPEFKEGGNSYGTSGGAIAVEGTDVTIDRTRFDASKTNKKVEFTGGFIMLVGNNDFTVRDSSFIGRGYEHNAKTLATYGGAICFESSGNREHYSTGNALIERTTFTDVAADMNGGAISLGTKKGDQAIDVKLTLKDSSITKARTFLYGTGGGFMYVGKGASAIITNTKMNTAVTSTGGGIYNEEGSVVLNGGTTLTSAWAVSFGGGIYNNGTLTVDDATLQSNITGNATWDLGSYAAKNNSEYTGMNIYAAKPVTITPNAKLEANKDVRVLDGKSWINLTGNLKNNIYVSISEKSLGANALESMERYVGYVVAKGQEYTLTEDDAQKLHYFSKKKEDTPYNQKVAEIGSHQSVGEWDTVLNPVNNYAVIGQRAEMNFDANGGQYKDGKTTIKDIYTIYGPNEGDSSRLSDRKAAIQLSEKPTRTDWEYLDYYNNKLSDLDRKALSSTDVTADKFDFSEDFHSRLGNGGAPIKDRLPENVRSLTAYARWVEPAPEPNPINVEIKVKKVLSGRDFKDGDGFKFILRAVGEAPMPKGEGNKVSVSDGKVKSFGAIEFTKAGTYKYLVSEENGTLPGVTYAKDGVSVEVVVEDDGNGKLTATVNYPDNGEEAAITNTYEAAAVTLSGENLIKVKKILTGRDFKQGDSFSFVLEGKDNAPMPTGTGNKVTVTSGDIANFGAISYSKAGTYKYIVEEEAGSIAGVTYSKESVEATVNVVDDKNGKLVATVTYGNGKSQAEFTNIYEAGAVTIAGDTAIKVKKTLSGRDFRAGDSFNFVLKAIGEAPMPAGEGNKVTVTDGTVKSFGDIKYTKAGTYVYNVTEERGTLEGITYAKEAVKVEVVVEDDGNGKLTATVNYPDNALEVNIVNTYTAKTGNVYVKYIDTEGNLLEDMSTIASNVNVGTDYSTTQKSFTGYKFLKNSDDSAPVKGTVKEGDQTVVYVYEKEEVIVVKGSVDVIYKDVEGNVLAGPDTVVKDVEVGTDYSTEKKDFDGYKFSYNPRESAPTTGKVKEGHQSVIYIYEKIVKPIVPEEPKPPVDKPEEPNKPVDNNPGEPNKPVEGNPDKPVTFNPQEKAVNTGDESTVYYLMAGAFSIFAALASGAKKNKKIK